MTSRNGLRDRSYVEKQLRNCRGCRAGADSPRTKDEWKRIRGRTKRSLGRTTRISWKNEEESRTNDEDFRGRTKTGLGRTTRIQRWTKDKLETNEGEVGDERRRSRRRMEMSSTWRNEKDQQTAEYICRTLRIRPRGCYRQIPNDSEKKSLPLLTGDEDK